MGAFMLVSNRFLENPSTCGKRAIREAMRRQGPLVPAEINTQNHLLFLSPKRYRPLQLWQSPNSDDFCAAVGTFFNRTQEGSESLSSLYARFSIEHPLPFTLSGTFCLIVFKQGRLYIIQDRLGLYQIFTNSELGIWSNLLVSLSLVTPRLSPSRQGLYEYIFRGASFGGDSVVKEIKRLRGNFIAQLEPTAHRYSLSPPLDLGTKQPLDVENCLARLRELFKEIAQLYGDSITCALSGGYDTRLMLALLLESGVRPKLYTYGRPSSPDLKVAYLIVQRLKLELDHFDREVQPVPSLDEFPGLIEKNFMAFDGCPEQGILDNGMDFKTRLQRANSGGLVLNGGGGEIFRNFWELSDRELSPRDFIISCYGTYDPHITTSQFREEEYLDQFEKKILKELDLRGNGLLSREAIEQLYPQYRCKYWMAKNHAINLRFTESLLPFLHFNVVDAAMRVPVTLKFHGHFQANLINLINPDLAALPSSYGHPLTPRGRPLYKRMGSQVVMHAPPGVRQFGLHSFIRYRDWNRPTILGMEFIEAIMEPNFPNLSKYIAPGKVRNNRTFNRICTLEYFYQKVGVR